MEPEHENFPKDSSLSGPIFRFHIIVKVFGGVPLPGYISPKCIQVYFPLPLHQFINIYHTRWPRTNNSKNDGLAIAFVASPMIWTPQNDRLFSDFTLTSSSSSIRTFRYFIRSVAESQLFGTVVMVGNGTQQPKSVPNKFYHRSLDVLAGCFMLFEWCHDSEACKTSIWKERFSTFHLRSRLDGASYVLVDDTSIGNPRFFLRKCSIYFQPGVDLVQFRQDDAVEVPLGGWMITYKTSRGTQLEWIFWRFPQCRYCLTCKG